MKVDGSASGHVPHLPGDSAAKVGLVLSGGGSRAAYQAGALKAIADHCPNLGTHVSVIVGTSIGAVNGIVVGAGLQRSIGEAAEILTSIWRERTYKNSFAGSASQAFLRSIRVAFVQYLSPGPSSRGISVFDPTPLSNRIDEAISAIGGLHVESMARQLRAVGIITTVEGQVRKPLLVTTSRKRLTPEEMRGAAFQVTYVPQLTAAHGFASAALPSVLPPVKLSLETGEVTCVDGGIVDNLPVDPAMRLGADKIITIDVSGRRWWFDHYSQPHDSLEPWEVPAKQDTFCLHPPEILDIRIPKSVGPLLKAAVARSSQHFITALGPTWPIFKLLKMKLGEDLAYEVLSYAALHPEYSEALIEFGYNETKKILEHQTTFQFEACELPLEAPAA